ncbi:hypothetical protein FOA52_002344 [Chlamydomonas sp. UWO 241]|nr:hypothetical protein FOA52_002344 [Chlamydomonas sp. UWO 241]
MRAAIALVLAALLCATLVAAEDAPAPGSGAAAFCKSSQRRSCGWASEEEWSQTEQGNCWLCTDAKLAVKLPKVIEKTKSGRMVVVVSLGCRPGKRCELQLPPPTPVDATEVADETEIEAARSSTEVNCVPCTGCNCPEAVKGSWFSDTLYAPFDGCDTVAEGEQYNPL